MKEMLKSWMNKQGWTPFKMFERQDGSSVTAHWESEDEIANVTYDGKNFRVQHMVKSKDGLEYLDYRD